MIVKGQHEDFAKFFSEPTRDSLREVLRKNIGETDYLDFKQDWPEIPKLARHILALANSGGGALIVGVSQDPNGTLSPVGMKQVLDKAKIAPPLTQYLPKAIEYHVMDFSYTASEYQALVGKAFQVLLVEDTPRALPFLSLKDGDGIRSNGVYVRSGTTSAEASHEQLQGVINRRIESGHSSQPELELNKHFSQLRALDELRPWNDSWLAEYLRQSGGKYEDNESTDFKDFIEEAYEEKKLQIAQLLGVRPHS